MIPQILFYFGDDIALLERFKSISVQRYGEIDLLRRAGFLLCTPKGFLDRCTVTTDHHVCAITGWARSSNAPPVDYGRPASFEPHLLNVSHSIFKGWPIRSPDITGNFSGVLYDLTHGCLKIFSDPGSIYPMYFARCSSGLLGGTHLLILQQILGSPADLAGVVERLSPPEFVNYGSRTIVQGVKRVLPGELISWQQGLAAPSQAYDNTLFNSPEMKGNISELAENIWDDYKTDTRACVGETKRVNLGLSGGWDSRLVAAALTYAGVDSIHCFTYGVEHDEYEVRLAERVAKQANAEFTFYDFSTEWAPSRDRFVRNLFSTEATYITQWLALLSRLASHAFEPFLLGDMLEAVAGRHLTRLSSRSGRKRMYWQRTFRNHSLPTSETGSFENWRSSQMRAAQTSAEIGFRSLTKEMRCDSQFSLVQEMVESDMSETISRIAQHELVFTDTYDELLTWYLRCINGTAKQVLSLNERFFGLSPTMSFRALRHISSINPFFRVSGELMGRVQKLPELSGFSRIPSANAPFVPCTFPLWFTDLIWASRSITDQWLIRGALKSRNPTARMRVVKTPNIPGLYNLQHASENVASWFSGRYVTSDPYLEIFGRRAHLQSWPLDNFDITGPGSLSLMLGLFDGEM